MQSPELSPPALSECAKSHGRTKAGVSLGWLLQQGLPLAVKSKDDAHLRENLQVLDDVTSGTWRLDSSCMEELAKPKQ